MGPVAGVGGSGLVCWVNLRINGKLRECHVHSSDNVFNSTHTYGCLIDGSVVRTVY